MEPSFRTSYSDKGLVYEGTTFPITETLANQADINRANAFKHLMNAHREEAKRRRIDFYTDFAILSAILALFSILVLLVTFKKRS